MVGSDEGAYHLGHKEYARPLVVGEELDSVHLRGDDLVTFYGFDGHAADHFFGETEQVVGIEDNIHGSYLRGTRGHQVGRERLERLGEFGLEADPEPYSGDDLVGVVGEGDIAENGHIILLHGKIYLFGHTSAEGNDVVHIKLRSAKSG